MSKIKGNSRDNVFYDTFDEMMEHYSNYITDMWKESKTVCMANTDAETGLFDKSDIICVYDANDHPSIITERIFRKNYTRRQWWHIKRVLKEKCKWLGQELGYNIRVTVSHDYIDYIHYKEEWWEWAKKMHASG